MSEVTVPSDEGATEEYRRRDHHERYGLQQHQFGLREAISISWTGSARELMREQAREAWCSSQPRGVLMKVFDRHESVIQIRTVPQAQALYGLITDELYRRQINQRQRNSLHRVRDELEAGWDEQIEKLREAAAEYYNGHLFRETGEVPTPSYSRNLAIDDGVDHDAFVRGRVHYHAGDYISVRNASDTEVEETIDKLPIMFGYD